MCSKNQYCSFLIFFLLIFFQFACNKLIDVSPPVTSYTESNVYSSDATAIAALTGIYTNMSLTFRGAFTTGNNSISLYTGLSGDELTLYPGATSTTYIAYYRNALKVNGAITAGSEYWAELYNKVFVCNAAIEGLNNSTNLSSTVKAQLTGEAKFMRAFFYFYLVNLFGDVPLATTTDSKSNAILGRTAKEKVYQQVMTDLKDAVNLLSNDYLDGNLTSYTSSQERVRPTKWAATALLARVYLYNNDYINAEAEASKVIDHTSLFSLVSLNNVFLKNNSEAIWQLQPSGIGKNTEDAITYILPQTGPSNNNPVYLSPYLLRSFEPGDERVSAWIDTLVRGTDTLFFPYKYKSATLGAPVTEYLIILRLAEQYLIRAEAKAQTGNLKEAAEDLNIIRMRAGLLEVDNAIADSKQRLLDAIFHERQVELFTEWGHRWLDLKRTGKINTIMPTVTQQKGGIWNTNWQWYPLPAGDLIKDPNLTQNTGY